MALLVGTTIAASTVGLAMSSENLFQSSKRRTSVSQALRSSLDVVGNEIRAAGILLPADFVAMEVIDGPFGTPDELVLRRNLISTVMPLCADLASGTIRDEVAIADGGGTPPPGCVPLPDGDGDTFPDNMDIWRDDRIARGGTVSAYIYNPTTRVGEFFDYDAEDAATFELSVGDGGTWANDYTVAQQSRIYLLEEQRFRLTGDLLEMVIDEDAANPLGISDLVEDFQVNVIFTDGTKAASLGAADDWGDVETIELTIDGAVTKRGRTSRGVLSARFNPRNVLSL